MAEFDCGTFEFHDWLKGGEEYAWAARCSRCGTKGQIMPTTSGDVIYPVADDD